MELRPGYKKTEIGVIPEDWKVLALKEVLASYELGGNYPNTTAPCPFPLMKMGNVSRGCFDLSKIEYVSGVVPSERHRLRDGDVIFNTRNTLDLVGKIAIWRDEVPIAYFNSNLMRMQFDHAVICSHHYASLTLNTEVTLSRLRAMATGTTSVAAIYTRDLLGLPIVVPPLPEQKAIAEALSDVDASIAALARLIAKKRDLRQGAMQRLLTGQTRLPGFGEISPHNPPRNTEIGTFPAEWSVAALGQLIEPGRGIRYGIVQPGAFDPAGRYMVRGQDYSKVKGWAKPDTVFRVSAAVEERYRNARVKAGDLIMTIVGYCGHVEMIPDWLDGANLTQTTARLAIAKSACSEFIKAILNSPIGERQVNGFLKGAAQPGLNCSDVEKFLVPLPSLEEQVAIARVLGDIDREIAALDARLDKTRALKQAMMQALLTGRVRLPVRRDAAPQTKEAAHA